MFVSERLGCDCGTDSTVVYRDWRGEEKGAGASACYYSFVVKGDCEERLLCVSGFNEGLLCRYCFASVDLRSNKRHFIPF